MNIDEIIRDALNAASAESVYSKEEKTDLLLSVLTGFLKSQLNNEEDSVDT